MSAAITAFGCGNCCRCTRHHNVARRDNSTAGTALLRLSFFLDRPPANRGATALHSNSRTLARKGGPPALGPRSDSDFRFLAGQKRSGILELPASAGASATPGGADRSRRGASDAAWTNPE
jgi:hypothetical protein